MRNKKEAKKKYRLLKAAGLGTTLIALLCIGVIISTMSFQDVVEVTQIKPRVWDNDALGDHDPTGDMGGYIYFMTYPHQATPATAYASNLTTGNAYEEHDIIDSELNNETPHSTTFDYVLKFRVNDTTSYNTSGTVWMPEWIYANITVDHDFATDVAWTNMTLVEIGNNSDFAWYHGYINNAGSGYQITNNEKFNATVNTTLWW